MRERTSGICRLFLIFCIHSFLLMGWSTAQNIEIVEQQEDRYHIRIDGEDYLAFPPDAIRKRLAQIDSLEIELSAAQEQAKADSALIESYETAVSAYRRNFALQDSLVGQVRSLYSGYRDLYFDYKKAYSEPLLYFHGGVGAAFERAGDEDVMPVVLMGFSVKRLSFMGFVNNDQSGLLLGLNYPIRFNFSFF